MGDITYIEIPDLTQINSQTTSAELSNILLAHLDKFSVFREENPDNNGVYFTHNGIKIQVCGIYRDTLVVTVYPNYTYINLILEYTINDRQCLLELYWREEHDGTINELKVVGYSNTKYWKNDTDSSLFELCKLSLSISQKSNIKDNEIQLWIDSAVLELKRLGIVVEKPYNDMITSAIVLYVKGHFGNVDIKDKELALKTFRTMVNNLYHTSEYIGYIGGQDDSD